MKRPPSGVAFSFAGLVGAMLVGDDRWSSHSGAMQPDGCDDQRSSPTTPPPTTCYSPPRPMRVAAPGTAPCTRAPLHPLPPAARPPSRCGWQRLRPCSAMLAIQRATGFDMAKSRTADVCNECGAEYSKWQGQCTECNAWNTLSQIILE